MRVRGATAGRLQSHCEPLFVEGRLTTRGGLGVEVVPQLARPRDVIGTIGDLRFEPLAEAGAELMGDRGCVSLRPLAGAGAVVEGGDSSNPALLDERGDLLV